MDTIILEVGDAGLISFYQSTVHNYATDSGYDLYIPNTMILPANSMTMVDLRVRCQLEPVDSQNIQNIHGYYLYPRSSISKTPLRLANSVGIIDFNYRGTLKVAVDNRSAEPYEIKGGERLFQLCMPDLRPFKVVLGTVNKNTDRGEGGFGSTNSVATK
jgi:dUTP pyrophosphatase